uniref:Symplekin/Pta1 N-terminal domain-containing protein n=2 Tax=Glycine max TaxID=3847 RepID=I1L9X8_SOYBN
MYAITLLSLNLIDQIEILFALILIMLQSSDKSFICSNLLVMEFHLLRQKESYQWALFIYFLIRELICLLLALKFLETFVFLFSSDIGDTEKLATKGIRQAVNVEWLVGGHPHPVLDPVVLISDANKTIGILLNLLLLVGSLPTCLTITVVNW